MTSSSPPQAGGRPDPAGGAAAPGEKPGPAGGYSLDNARAEAGERFVWLAELFDGVTRGHFERLGVRAGSRCWEVGAGGPGIPEALAAAVGPAGHVLATDIDPSWLKAATGTRCASMTSPPIRPRSRGRSTWSTPGSWRANRLRDAVRELLARRGADLRYGRTLPRALREAGLADAAAAGAFPVGGLATGRLEASTIRHVRGELLAAGLAGDAEIDAHLAAIDAGELDLTLAPLISAWGRRRAG